MDITNSYTLITGASGGIGFELAKIAASRHHNLVLIARNEKRLNELKEEWEILYSVRIIVVVSDLSESGAIDKIIDFLHTNHIQIDILINNAGFGLFGFFDRTDLERETNMLQVNVIALTQLTKYIFREMITRKSGRIMNLASVAGFFPGPLMSVYYASKAYVLSFSQALANEAKNTGVSITVLCPGPTKSNFVRNADLETSRLFSSFGKISSAEAVAKYGFRSMEKGKTVAVFGVQNRLLLFFAHFLPRKMLVNMIRYVQRPVN